MDTTTLSPQPKATFAIDVAEPPARTKTIVRRIVRDTATSMALKELYKFKCQVCRGSLRVPSNVREWYAEVHHLRPLGGEHEGLDRFDNMIVVCPGCHAGFDLVAIGVHPKTLLISRFNRKGVVNTRRKLSVREPHTLNSRNLRYHWKQFQDAAHSAAGPVESRR